PRSHPALHPLPTRRSSDLPRTRARVRTRSVLATPGTPSTRAWCPVKMAMSARSIAWSCPMITLPTSPRASLRTSMSAPPSAFIVDLHLHQRPADAPVAFDRIGRLLPERFQRRDQVRAAPLERPDPHRPADAQDVGCRDAPFEDGDEPRGRVATRHGLSLLRVLLLARRDERDRGAPHEEDGREQDRGHEAVQPVAAHERGDALPIENAEMRLVEDDGAVRADEPRDERCLRIAAQPLVAQDERVGRQDQASPPEGSLDEDRPAG